MINSLFAAVDFTPIVSPIIDVLNAVLWPMIAVVGAAGTIYCVILGVRIAKSDDPNSREKAKRDLLGAIIGFVLIFVLIIALKLAMPILQDWVKTEI